MARPRKLRGARQAVARLPQRRHVQVLGRLRMRSVCAAHMPRMCRVAYADVSACADVCALYADVHAHAYLQNAEINKEINIFINVQVLGGFRVEPPVPAGRRGREQKGRHAPRQ